MTPLKVAADIFVRLLQMSVLPYVTLSILCNLGTLTPELAKKLGFRAGGALAVLWITALLFALLFPLAFPKIDAASFYSPVEEQASPPNLVDFFIPSNPFHALANSIVPAVVLFSILLGLALIGIENKQPLLDVLGTAMAAVGRVTSFVVGLTPYGIFAIAAHATGTLDVQRLARIEIYLVSYVVFALLLSLWVLPGIVSALTPVGAMESLAASRDALLTAFLVGDLFIVLPTLMEGCSKLIARRFQAAPADRELPGTIVPVSFTFPHSGKLLSLSFILFAGWLTDSAVSVLRYPELTLSGFLSFFGSLNFAVPFLLDLFRIPVDSFQLFIATGVINARFGTLLAAVHTIAVCLLGSAAMTGAIRFQPGRLIRFAVVTVILTGTSIAGLRLFFSKTIRLEADGRSLVYHMKPLAHPPAEKVLSPSDVADSAIPPADGILTAIRARKTLRVGIIADGIPFAYENDAHQLIGLDVEMARRLAADLGVEAEFYRFPQEELTQQVQARRVDIVITGARLTPERAAVFAVSEPYLFETLAAITLDHNRQKFHSWERIRNMRGLRLGVQNLPYYLTEIRRLLPQAQLELIPETKEMLDPAASYDAYLLPAERGSVLTIMNPRFTVVIPDGATIKMPLAYPIAGEDPRWTRYVNTWIELKKQDGFVQALYDHWILGKAAAGSRGPRWSIIRDVLHWVP